MPSRSVYLAIVVIGALFTADYFYFKDLRIQNMGGAIDESFVRNGRLGNLLKNNGLIGIASDSEYLATQNLCASEEHINSPSDQLRYRLRFSLHVKIQHYVEITIAVGSDDDVISTSTNILLEPNKYWYSVDVNAQKNEALSIQIKPLNRYRTTLVNNIEIDAPNNKSTTLLRSGVALIGSVDARNNLSKIEEVINTDYFSGIKSTSANYFDYQLKQLPEEIQTAAQPSKKSSGYCRYEALIPKKIEQSTLVPGVTRISIDVDDEFLNGDKGIFNHLLARGRSYEVPAKVTFSDKLNTFSQMSGLRFHGGVHRRKPNGLNGYRIYARSEYGFPTLNNQPFFENSAAPVRTLVLRNNQALGSRDEEYGKLENGFSPYAHAFALDIGREIGAVVPRSRLVDLHINDERQDLYLALEHLSARTFNRALGHENALFYIYKNHNHLDVDAALKKIGTRLYKYHDNEKLFSAFTEHFDVDNAINSIILSSYIGDIDYCQGVDIVEDYNTDESPTRVTIVNWDLDNGFIRFKRSTRTSTISPEILAFNMFKKFDNKCFRRYILYFMYQESSQFRQLLRERLETLFANELSEQNLTRLLDKYATIDSNYYNNKYQQHISDLRNFIKYRPEYMLAELDQLEKSYER